MQGEVRAEVQGSRMKREMRGDRLDRDKEMEDENRDVDCGDSQSTGVLCEDEGEDHHRSQKGRKWADIKQSQHRSSMSEKYLAPKGHKLHQLAYTSLLLLLLLNSSPSSLLNLSS